MRIIIFGSTGSIGRQLLLQSLNSGHQVTAFARSADKLSTISHSNLDIFKGNVLDALSVEKAVPGHDAVLCALGAGRKGGLRAPGTLNIVRAMEKAAVKRLICESTLGAGDSYPSLNFYWKRIMFGWLLKEAFQDHQLQEKHVLESGLDWTIVRPGAFTDGPATGNYRHGFAPEERGLKLKVSRADVAMFMLDQLDSSRYLRKAPSLSY